RTVSNTPVAEREAWVMRMGKKRLGSRVPIHVLINVLLPVPGLPVSVSTPRRAAVVSRRLRISRWVETGWSWPGFSPGENGAWRSHQARRSSSSARASAGRAAVASAGIVVSFVEVLAVEVEVAAAGQPVKGVFVPDFHGIEGER